MKMRRVQAIREEEGGPGESRHIRRFAIYNHLDLESKQTISPRVPDSLMLLLRMNVRWLERPCG